MSVRRNTKYKLSGKGVLFLKFVIIHAKSRHSEHSSGYLPISD